MSLVISQKNQSLIKKISLKNIEKIEKIFFVKKKFFRKNFLIIFLSEGLQNQCEEINKMTANTNPHYYLQNVHRNFSFLDRFLKCQLRQLNQKNQLKTQPEVHLVVKRKRRNGRKEKFEINLTTWFVILLFESNKIKVSF